MSTSAGSLTDSCQMNCATSVRLVSSIVVVRKRLEISGPALFFVTTTVKDWKPAFSNKAIALAVLSQLRETLHHYDVSLTGYVLMPSHLHAILGFQQAELLSRFMQSFKILSSKKVKAFLGTTHSDFRRPDGTFALWKPRFDELVITSEKQLKVKLNYIHANPVRAGLAATAEGWPFSSAAAWYQDKPSILEIDRNFKWLI